MPNTQYKVRNWKEYNKNLKARGTIIFSFSRDLPKLYYSGEQQRGGSRKYSKHMYEYMLYVKILLRLPWRATEGYVRKLLEEAFPDCKVQVPNYAHASREANKLKLKVKQFSPKNKSGMELAFDSTGVNVYTTSGWHQRKYNKDSLCRKRDQWKKVHVVMELGTRQIVSVVCSKSNVNDCEVIGELFSTIGGKIKNIRADGAYDTEKMYKIGHDRGAKVIIPPAITAKSQDELIKKPREKKEHLLQRDETIKMIRGHEDFATGLKQWKIANNYHKRSLIEAMMFRLKRTFGFYLQQKTDSGRINEIISKVNILNLMISHGRAEYKTI